MDSLILVDENDKEIGYEEKARVHVWPSKLHRAFSIFIFNKKGEMLIHRRASNKQTWPDFWTNACCSHPRRGETLAVATQRRLKEELGFACPLKELFSFVYDAKYDDKFGENEFDHVFVGNYDGPIKPNENEVSEWKFVSIAELMKDVNMHSKKYTPWFKLCVERVINKFL